MIVTADASVAAALVVLAAAVMRTALFGARRLVISSRRDLFVEPVGDRPRAMKSRDLGRGGFNREPVAASGLLAFGVTTALWWSTRSWLTAVLGLLAFVVSMAVLQRGNEKRREQRIERSLPGIVEEMARSLRGGSSFHQALGDVAWTLPDPVGAELKDVSAKVALGVGFDRALAEWAALHPSTNVRLFCGATTLSMRAGTDSGRALDGLAQSMRDKATVEQETKALVAQAQLSGLVIAALPVAFLGVSLLIDRGGAAFLLTTPIGRGCLVGALFLDAVGYSWMRHLARSVAL